MFSTRFFFVFVSLFLALTSPAHAKGFLLFNTGDELFEVKEFPAKIVAQLEEAKDYKIGYKCNHFGIFWADVYTWNCKLVAVTSKDSYADIPEEILSELSSDAEYAMGNAKRGFWNHYAFWTIVGGFLALTVFGMIAGKKEE